MNGTRGGTRRGGDGWEGCDESAAWARRALNLSRETLPSHARMASMKASSARVIFKGAAGELVVEGLVAGAGFAIGASGGGAEGEDGDDTCR